MLLVFNILLMTLLLQAASRKTTNSKPSLEIRVTYFEISGFWLELAIAMDVSDIGSDVDFDIDVWGRGKVEIWDTRFRS